MAKVTGFSKAGSSSSHRSVRGQPSLSGRDMRAVDALPTWGSRDYMSSEQIRGRGGQAADVYAFGMLLWQARVYGGGGGALSNAMACTCVHVGGGGPCQGCELLCWAVAR